MAVRVARYPVRAPWFATSVASSQSWKTLKIGAGGYLTSAEQTVDGAVTVIRTDTYGAYRWNGSAWVQLVTADTMPSADQLPYSAFGVYEIVIAPSNTARFYMMWGSDGSASGRVYRTDNSGATWTRCGTKTGTFDPNDGTYGRWFGSHMMVDPANADVVYAGFPNSDGLYQSTDAGATWTNLAPGQMPVASGRGYCPMIADTAGGTQGSGSTLRTKRLYIGVAGSGFYKSTDGGATWAAMAGDPPNPRRIVSSFNGSAGVESTMYCTSDTQDNYVLDGGTWSILVSPTGWATWAIYNDDHNTVAINPDTAAGARATHHVVFGDQAGKLTITYDGGTTAGGYDAQNYNVGPIPAWPLSATDIPWLPNTDPQSTFAFVSAGQMFFDPTGTRKLFVSAGVGCWTTTIPATSGSMPTHQPWTSQSAGIEQLVVNKIIKPPGGQIVIAVWDQALFITSDPDTYPAASQQKPAAEQGAVDAAWGVDYSGQTPSFLVTALSFQRNGLSAYSTDSGSTWTAFATYPTGFWFGGDIACSGDPSATSHIVGICSNKWPYYSDDKGTTWTAVTITGLTQGGSDLAGFHRSFVLTRQCVTADKVNAAKFWLLYTPTTQADGVTGIYASTDGGHNWAITGFNWDLTNSSSDFWKAMYFAGNNAQLAAVPGHEGHLFLTAGQSGGSPDALTPADQTFVRSTDGGVTWTKVANVAEVWKFGFGPTVGSYNRVWIYGWVSNVLGVWYSDDNCSTWTRLPASDFPNRNIDLLTAVCGNPDNAAQVFIGFRGSGAAYYG